jgi:hypothetical protein
MDLSKYNPIYSPLKFMLMNDLIKTEFFSLIAGNSQEVTNEEIQNAYEKFIAYIDTLSQVGNVFTTIIRKLNITRIELVSLLKQNQYEQGKKCA